MSDGSVPSRELQFERAEFETPPARACTSCKRPLENEYFECNGQMVCPECASGMNAYLASRRTSAGFWKAAGAGLGAAIAGAAVYAAVRMTGYEFSLIAILVGYVVGRAVRWGSGGMGGRSFQALAMVLTYVSIASSSLPFLVNAITKQGVRLSAFGWLYAFGISLWLPFAEGFGNILGIIIIGIGVWEAWRLNRGAQLRITGPYQLKTEQA